MKRKNRISIRKSPYLIFMLLALMATQVMAQVATRNKQLEAILKPSSTATWLQFREEAKINPLTIFVDYKVGFGLTANNEMVLAETKDDDIGMHHYNYNQYYKNVKVLHGHFKIHQRADGMVQTANGNIITGLNLDLTTTVNENEALANALSFMNAKKYLWQNEVSENELKRTENNVNATYFPKGELVFAPANYDVTYLAADYRLTWQFTIYSDDINVAAKCVFVDALSGKVVYHYDISMSCSIGTSTTTWNGSPTISTRLSGGLYQSHNDCQATDIITYNRNGGAQSNTYYTDANNAWTAASQASSAQAQYGARGTYN